MNLKFNEKIIGKLIKNSSKSFNKSLYIPNNSSAIFSL